MTTLESFSIAGRAIILIVLASLLLAMLIEMAIDAAFGDGDDEEP